MRNLLIIFFILFFSLPAVFAFSVKVYDEYGNRVGTYKKDGENYELYDFNDKKIESPEQLIKNPPTQKTLTEYTQTLYDENMIPIGTFRSGLYGNDGSYYPRGLFYPYYWTPYRYEPSITRPRAQNIIKNPMNGSNNINHRHADNLIKK